jgi:hypothetical protein
MAYRITKTLNDWTKRGARTNVRIASIEFTSDPVEAGKMFAAHGTGYGAVTSSTITAVDIETGAEVAAIDFYRAVIGEELFAKQYANEDFSINLDDFFKAL